MKIRLLTDNLFIASSYFFGLLGCSLIICIISFLIYKGAPAISFEFLTSESRNFGAEGGIAYQIIGTIWMVVGAAIVSLPISLGTALYQSEFVPYKYKSILSNVIFLLNGIPSIVFGLFGFLLFCQFLGLGISWVSGALILGIMITPTVTVAIKETLDNIPSSVRESALGLGFDKKSMITRVLVPESVHGIITGLLLGLTRAAGETAPIMFTATAFFGATLPSGISEPITTLQTHMLVLVQESVNPDARLNAWGAALVLLSIVMIMSLISLRIRKKYGAISRW